MNELDSKVTLHMVCSLDGFVARKDGDVSWLQSEDNYEKGIELTDEMIKTFVDDIDCYVMGSRTYEHALVLGWPYSEKPVYVLTKRQFESERSNVTFHSGDVETLVRMDLKSQYNNIWMAGGPSLTKTFIQKGLADEIVVSFMPVLLGDGLLFFDFVRTEQKLHLMDVQTYRDGMVELTYKILKVDN